MTCSRHREAHGRRAHGDPPPSTTLVELTFRKGRVEHWIRFGHRSFERILDRHRSIAGFAPGSIFALNRWAANDHETVVSRIDILRAARHGDAFQTLPFVRPGGEILLRLTGWPKVRQVLRAIDAVEALGIDPAAASPDHWRQVHNRLSAGLEPDGYTEDRHAAWMCRRRLAP